MRILKAPFRAIGAKDESVKFLLEHLPKSKVYCEPYGGSGVVLLNKSRCETEVFNDAYSGVTDFYKCLRDPEKLVALVARLELTVHSREEFKECLETWENIEDSVERAARWYYMIEASRIHRGAKFRDRLPGEINAKLPHFAAAHERFQGVIIENLEGFKCIQKYDSPDTVFYLDPPYVGARASLYNNDCDQYRLMDVISKLKGFVAVSSYHCTLYDSIEWNEIHESPKTIGVRGGRFKFKEQLFIKKARRQRRSQASFFRR